MPSVRAWASLSRALRTPIDLRLKRLLIERRDQLGVDQDLSTIARFVIVQPGDSLAALESKLGYSVFLNPVDESQFGEPEFSPRWEWIADHGHCFEMVFIFDDNGFAHVVLVQNSPMQNRKLRALCQSFAS